jgi:acyl-CoA synthetase (AMP-forming)/AMP-acid ligase II
MDLGSLPFVLATMARRGLLNPGSPIRVAQQLLALQAWGYGLAGELRSAAARDPGRVAVVDERGEVSYGALLLRSERLARGLRSVVSIGPGDRVGLLCRNHGGLIEALVATALLGADAVLINTGLAGPQLVGVATEQRLRVLLHDNDFAGLLAGLPDEVRPLDESQTVELLAQAPPGELRPPAQAGRTIVLTSGTTGTPKGAHRPTPPGLHPLMSIISRIPLHTGERMLIAAPLFHTWGYAALQLGLALRATIVLQRRFEPAAALGALGRHGCSALFAVPVMLQRILEVPHRPTALRVAAVSGSALPRGLATRFMDAYGDVLYNLYGSTEASWVSIATPAELRRDPATAGRPPHGTRVAIVDSHGNPVPAGVTGRIFAGNEMLFDGYTSGDRREIHDDMIFTGDLGHLSAEGLLFVDGREDDMIVSGGENVFPAEVEHVIAELPQVREVAVTGVPDERYGQRLAAYVVRHHGQRLDAETVRAHVRRVLARFAVPRDVVFVRELPRNETGKVVPRALPPPG